jgi:S-adenosylmethionine uptake transporter
LPTTQRHRLEYLRGAFLFLSYTTFFMGLAALPLADVEAIRFSGPLMITLLSVAMLGETVGLRRWIALLAGFLGVFFIVRPTSVTFNLGSVFILISVFFYALSVILVRKLQSTDSSATMAYYSSLVYLLAAVLLAPLVLLFGESSDVHPSLAFLFRSWAMPSLLDLNVMFGMGLAWAGGMFCMARAYSLAPASVVAPFEYSSLPIGMMWGFVIWREIPTLMTLSGAFLTLLSGLYILHRERVERNGQ